MSKRGNGTSERKERTPLQSDCTRNTQSFLHTRANKVSLRLYNCTGIFSKLRAKLCDWAVRPARAGCYSWAELSFSISCFVAYKIACQPTHHTAQGAFQLHRKRHSLNTKEEFSAMLDTPSTLPLPPLIKVAIHQKGLHAMIISDIASELGTMGHGRTTFWEPLI